MNFIVFMVCVIFAIFFGMVLDRALIRSIEAKSKASKTTADDGRYNIVIFEKEESAKTVMSGLEQFLNDNEVVRLYDLCLISRVKGAIPKKDLPKSYKYGWTDISDFKIVKVDDNYAISVPKPKLLEK